MKKHEKSMKKHSSLGLSSLEKTWKINENPWQSMKISEKSLKIKENQLKSMKINEKA